MISTERAVVAAGELVKPGAIIFAGVRGACPLVILNPFELWSFPGNCRVQIFDKWKNYLLLKAGNPSISFESDLGDAVRSCTVRYCWCFCTILATFLHCEYWWPITCLLFFTTNCFARGFSLLLPIKRGLPETFIHAFVDSFKICKHWLGEEGRN